MTKCKKIIVFWPRYLSSQRLFFETLLKHPGVIIVFVGQWQEGNAYNEKKDGYKELNSTRVIQWEFKEIRYSKLPFKDILLMSTKIWSIVRSRKFDLVITSTQYPLHSKIAFLFSKLLRIKIAVYTEEWIFKKSIGLTGQIRARINKVIERHSDYILTQSEHKSTIYQLRGVSPEKTKVFPFLVNDYMKDNWKVRSKQSIIKLLYLGRFIELKGIDVLLAAFMKVVLLGKPVELVLAGSTKADLLNISPNVSKLYEAICEEGNESRIEIIGYISESEKIKIINDIDVLVFPTKTHEGWGISLMDGTQSGAVCIATDVVASSRELIIDGQNGFIVGPGDSDGLADAIIKCTDLSNDEFQSFSRKSRELFCKYNDPDRVLKLLYDL